MNYINAGIAIFMMLLCSFGGYKVAESSYEGKIANVQQVQATATINAQKAAAQIVQQEQSKSQEIANAYASQAAYLQRFYSSRLRQQPPAVRSGMPLAAQSASSPAPAASDAVPAEQCAQTTLMLVDLQKWIKEEGLQ